VVAVWCGGRVDSAFDSCSKDTGLKPAEANHYVTTVGKLFTPTVSVFAIAVMKTFHMMHDMWSNKFSLFFLFFE